MEGGGQGTEAGGASSALPLDKVKAAAMSGLSAAATKAKLFADQEEREIQRLVAAIVHHQVCVSEHTSFSPKSLDLSPRRSFTRLSFLAVEEARDEAEAVRGGGGAADEGVRAGGEDEAAARSGARQDVVRQVLPGGGGGGPRDSRSGGGGAARQPERSPAGHRADGRLLLRWQSGGPSADPAVPTTPAAGVPLRSPRAALRHPPLAVVLGAVTGGGGKCDGRWLGQRRRWGPL